MSVSMILAEKMPGNLLLGFGVWNLMFGGMILFSRARTAFIKLEMPAEASEWPRFGLTEPI